MEPADLLVGARTIAVVGCSATPGKAAHDIPALLQGRGWNVVPVNPRHDEVLGVKCYPNLADVPEDIDLVDVFRPPEEAAGVAAAAVAAGARVLWLQLGITSSAAGRLATDAGLDFVEDACTGALAARLDLRPAAD